MDNTGNVCIWPGEELLSYYLFKNKEIIQNRTIELGSGLSGLSGITCSILGCENVCITDGHPNSVENIEKCIELNKQSIFSSKYRVVRML